VHYVSGVGTAPGPDGQFGRMLHWLTGGALQFASCGNPYDIVRLPGFEFGIEHPQAAFRKALEVRFPRNRRRSRPGSSNWMRRANRLVRCW
jgi:all-trans-retinol 13,14-reductase